MRRLIAAGALAAALLVAAACSPPQPPPVVNDIHVIIVACQMDSGQVYAEITLFQSGWYSVYYADGRWTQWQWGYQWTTLSSVHAGDFYIRYSLSQQPDDDQVVIPEGGTFHVGSAGQPTCTKPA